MKDIQRVIRSYFKTYTRYSGIVNEEQKKVLNIFEGSFESRVNILEFFLNIVGGSDRYFNFFKGGFSKKKLKTLTYSNKKS